MIFTYKSSVKHSQTAKSNNRLDKQPCAQPWLTIFTTLIYFSGVSLNSVCFLAGRGGRVAAHGGTLSSFIVKNIALDKTDDSNPRQAILRHAKEAAENPYWVAPAYKA